VADFHLKQGDLLPKIRSTLTYSDGTAVDLTGGSVVFRMRLRGASTPKVEANATIVTAASGIVEYTWTGTDTNAAGEYEAEWVVTLSGSTFTVPNDKYLHISILANLDG
jgi:uncharacterized protein YaiE (UPF0345 family)